MSFQPQKAEIAGELTALAQGQEALWTVLKMKALWGFARLLTCLQAPAYGWGDSSLPGVLGAGLIPKGW